VLAQQPRDPVGDVAAVDADAVGQFLGGGVELVDVVLPLVEVVAHFLVRLGDGGAARAVGEAVLGGRGQLGAGVAVAAVHGHHGARHARVGGDHLGDLLGVRLDAELLVHHDLLQLGDEPGVVLGGEEGGVDAEDLADLEQHRHRQRAHVVLDLVEVTGRDLELLGQHDLTQAALGAQLPQSRSHIGLGHSASLEPLSQPCQRVINSAASSARDRAPRCAAPARLP